MQNKYNKVTKLLGVITALAAIDAQAAVSTTEYDYNLDAGTVTVTDDNGKSIVSYYDVVNRLDKIVLPGSDELFDFGYDPDIDLLTTATYPGGQQTFGYDDLDRLDSLSEFGITDLVKFDYDHRDRVTAIIYGTGSDNGINGVVCYQYDPDGRLKKVGRNVSGTDKAACNVTTGIEWTVYGYDAKGRLKTRTYHNDLQSYWDYDPSTGQLVEIGHLKSNGALIYSDAFVYVPGTNLYEKILHTDANGLKTTNYDYDAYQRLTRVAKPDDFVTEFKYDDFGNRTYQIITHPGGEIEQHRYDYDGNRLMHIYYTPAGGTEGAEPQQSFTYDNVGRIETRTINGDETTLAWDDRGYLTSLSNANTNISYTYNALGARTSKTVDGFVTKYVTAPVFGMNHVLMELDATNKVTKRYVYGGHQQLIQESTPGNDSNDHFLLHGGSVGNITHAMNRDQAVVNQYDYDAFGKRTPVLGNESTTFGYTGEQYDSESELLYLRARYYYPEIGRFITVDPYLGRMDEPVTQNRYIYVHNNPVLYTDPSGHEVWGINIGVSGTWLVKDAISWQFMFDSEGTFAVQETTELGGGLGQSAGGFANLVFGAPDTVEQLEGPGMSFTASSSKLKANIALNIPLSSETTFNSDDNFESWVLNSPGPVVEAGINLSMGSELEGGVTYTTTETIISTPILGEIGSWIGTTLYDCLK